jgi:hypothetical protein
LPDQAREYVGHATRGIADDDAHRPRRIRLRPSETRDRQEAGGASDLTQKSTARTFHDRSFRTSAIRTAHSALIPAALMMGHHFSISAF